MGRHRTPATEPTDPKPSPLACPEVWAAAVVALGLSPRQARIVELVLQGRKDKQIAVTLGLSPHTVRTYLTRIFARLGVEDRVGVVVRVCSVCLQTRAGASVQRINDA